MKELYLQGMNIGGCLACEGCQRNGGTCVQNDDMQIVSEAFLRADVVVFASPQYWGTITGQLKIGIDRLYAVLFGAHIVKQFVVIMTARGNMYEMTEDFFSIFTRFLGWKILVMFSAQEKKIAFNATGAVFVMNGRTYHLDGQLLQGQQAYKSGLSCFFGKPEYKLYDPVDGHLLAEDELLKPVYNVSRCVTCSNMETCIGCVDCGGCKDVRLVSMEEIKQIRIDQGVKR